jgi:hypothetical protein
VKRFVITYGAVSIAVKLHQSLVKTGGLQESDEFRSWNEKSLPPRVDPRARPFSQVVYALEQALNNYADFALWLNPSVKVVKDLSPIWEAIDQRGGWFMPTGNTCEAHPVVSACLNVDAPTSELSTSVFGLDLRQAPALRFLVDLKKHVKDGCFDAATSSQFSYLISTLVPRHGLYVDMTSQWVSATKTEASLLVT